MLDVRIRHDERADFTPGGVSFDVGAGEVVLLLGPSGCGKSTLALATNGLIPHALAAEVDGTIQTAGIVTTDASVPQLSEHVAMVFQDPDSQIVTGTLFDEVCFGPENLLLPLPVVLERAESALRAVGLWERRADNPDVLSGGGRQRLAIACALAMGSDLLVLDEPTANLDPVGTTEVYRTLADVVAEGSRSILLIEHNLDAAMDIVDRVVVLDREGRVALSGTPREILARRAVEVSELGVWLPVATIAALTLERGGLTLAERPLTPAELTTELNGIRSLPAVEPPAAHRDPRVHRLPVPMPAGAVTVRRLSVTRGRTTVLRDVTLSVEPGDFLAIIGANGAGKTTLLQAIAGVVAPPKGRVSVGELDPATSDVRALAGHIGFVFQNPEHQFVAHTVADELAHGLRHHATGVADRHGGDGGRSADDRVDEMLARFGLEHLRDVHPFLLSGGQKRRLSVGTALIAGAPVLALDEPTFGQDRERADELLGLLSQLHQQGTTVITVTHDMQLVTEYATHVAVLADGVLRAVGATADIMADDELIEGAGLRLPPLARAMRGLTRHPSWQRISRLRDLPGWQG
ncbi:ABC transporter ATP-binding protein [Okibacterium endophyticum]